MLNAKTLLKLIPQYKLYKPLDSFDQMILKIKNVFIVNNSKTEKDACNVYLPSNSKFMIIVFILSNIVC